MRLTDQHQRFLARTAADLSKRLGRSVSSREVLEAILDLSMKDVDTFDAPSEETVCATERAIYVRRDLRTQGLGVPELLEVLSTK